MRLFRSIEQFAGYSGPRVVGVTIGNFDGFHLGHQALLAALRAELGTFESEVCMGMLTFRPHPRVFFRGLRERELREHHDMWPVTALREKIALGSAFDFMVLQRFDIALAESPPELFLRQYLLGGLRARVVVVGHDWRFGKDRTGDVELLHEFGRQNGIRTVSVPPVTLDGERVSSSRVRKALLAGEMNLLSRLLGRRHSMTGRVVRGSGRGGSLGFPTANLHVGTQLLPGNGVYAGFVYLRGERFEAVTNIGVRPTFSEEGRRIVETHLLALPRISLYGERFRLEFVERLRSEQKFPSAAALQAEIERDISRAREALAAK